MPSTTPQREFWNGQPVTLGNGFTLTKWKGERLFTAICTLKTHQLGFELVLEVNGLMSRTQVWRSTDEVLALTEQWRKAMLSVCWCFCADGWVCEDHPDLPGGHPNCGGAWMPCPHCNTSDPPRMPRDLRSFVN